MANSARATHRTLGFFRDRWKLRRDRDERPYYEASILFQAADMSEAERFFDAMVESLGCGEGVCDENTPCPHFRVAGLHQLDEGDV